MRVAARLPFGLSEMPMVGVASQQAAPRAIAWTAGVAQVMAQGPTRRPKRSLTMMTRMMVAGAVSLACLAGLPASLPAAARARGDSVGVPALDVKQSCTDAQKFSSGNSKDDSAYRGCMQDESNARTDLAKRWSTFAVKDRQDCVEQSRNPSPSYVEVLTCLEMSSNAIRNAPKVNGQAVPQIGGPVAPGLAAPVGHAQPRP